jgi:GAF domain-containing protein
VAELDVARRRARRAEARLGHVRQITGLAKPGRGLEEVSQEILDLAVELLDGDAGALWLRTRGRGDLTLGASRRALGRRSPRPHLGGDEVMPLTGAAPLHCPPSPLLLPRALLRDEALGAAVLLPLHRDGELVGLLLVGRSGPARPFEATDTDRVLELVDVATAPLVDVCLRDEVRARGRQVRAGRRIARAIAAGPAFEEIFRIATHELGRLVPFDAAALVVPSALRPGGQVVVGERGKLPRPVTGIEVPANLVSSGIPADRAVILPDVAAEPGPLPGFLRDLAPRALLAVPLALGGGTAGSLVLLSRTRGRFRRAHLREVRPVAEQLALAVRLQAFRREATVGVEDRLRLEVRLARAERYATIGRLASALAHEIRNPLTVIGATVQYLRDRLAPVQYDR